MKHSLRRALAVAGAALLCTGITAAAPAGGVAPTYTGWSAPVNLGPIVNSTAAEAGPALSGDGLSLYFYVPDRPGGFGGNDIWVSQRPTASAAWGTPMNLGAAINTASSEFVPAFSPDGHWMFFGSDRPGGFGGQDIYRSFRPDVHNDFGWQTPTNLGAGVNSPADDNASSYFENGGHPQLFFGSGRLGGAARDLFLSNLQSDGTWGPATLIPELSSPTTENRPAVSQDGLEIFFYSDRPGGSGGNDLWTSKRASTDAPWSTPVNVGPTVNTSGTEQHPYLSADGRTLVFSSNRAGGSGSLDLWVTTRNAELTVTANSQSRVFGQANPPLTYAITGFVGGDTPAVVSGMAACTTTATPTSPAGSYPITCTAGTLAAAGYNFATFVPGTLTVWAVVAQGLDNPRGLDFGEDGALYVAEAGRGGAKPCGIAGDGTLQCLGLSGAITRVQNGVQTRIATSLPSLSGPGGFAASGPMDVDASHGNPLYVAMGCGCTLHQRDVFVPWDPYLGELLRVQLDGFFRPVSDPTALETLSNPDHMDVNSNPNATTAIGGRQFIVDAGGNDLLEVPFGSRDRFRPPDVDAVFPTQLALAPPFLGLPPGTMIPSQSVPTSVTPGPDGALYVGELTGFPFPVGGARVYRVGPNSFGPPQVYASGFTNIIGVAFDGPTLYVLEIRKAGLLSPDMTGALIRVNAGGSQTEIASTGLVNPTGLAIRNGAAYVSNFGTAPGVGQVVRIPLS